MNQWYFVATVLRCVLILYGQWQDATMAVKYTDVDYFVFTDASKFVLQVITFFVDDSANDS